jgi:hypothetical protein
MFPEHCKDVSVKKVSFPLTKEEIRKNLVNKLIYKRTRFIALNNGDDWAVVSVQKPQVKNLFSRIQDIDIISLPASTKYLEDPEIDVLSPTRMAEKAQELGADTLIIKGMFEHVSFIHKEIPIPIMVLEVVPPEPPKLVELVKKALGSGKINKPVKIIPQIVDLRKMAEGCKYQNIVYPCQGSGLSSGRNTFFLDQRPKFTDEQLKRISLIGCDLSLRIFKIIYGIEPEFFNFCPKKRIIDMQPEQLALTKCCKIKEGHERIGNTAIVPWGATLSEVEDSLKDLLADKHFFNGEKGVI